MERVGGTIVQPQIFLPIRQWEYLCPHPQWRRSGEAGFLKVEPEGFTLIPQCEKMSGVDHAFKGHPPSYGQANSTDITGNLQECERAVGSLNRQVEGLECLPSVSGNQW